MEKIRILFVNRDGAGVNYWRTLTPAMEIERNHKDVFVEINPNIDFNQLETMDYLRTFNIIHYHTSLVDGIGMMKNIANELKSTGVVLVLDIDDYWELPKNHPQYYFSLDNKLKYFVTENIKIADYITTTNELFVEEIKKISGKDNVISLPNSVNPEWMKQFQDNRTPSPDGKVRIVYMGGSCYDDQTEILTEEGFKLFKDLNKTEKVATLNNDGYLEYQQPTNYTDESYSGDMFFGKNKNIDFAVTPNHNMFIHDSNSSKRTKPFKFELKKMENLENKYLTFKKNAKWSGVEQKYFTITKFIGENKTFNDITFEMDDWLKFYGFWLGDGWTTKDGSKQVGICGVKPISISTMIEIEEIFRKYNYNPTWTKDGKQLRIFNHQLYEYMSQFGGAKEKFVPRFIKDLSQRQLNIFLEYYLRADGTVEKNGRSKCFTISKKIADDISEIALKIGYCGTFRNRGIRTSIMIDGRIVTGKSDGLEINIYRNGIKSQLTPTVKIEQIKKETYNGKIYCVTVPNHILYVRRNGLSYWCGNSHLADLEQVKGIANVLNADPDTKDKFKIVLAGWDSRGSTTDVKFNEEFGEELKKLGMLTKTNIQILNRTKGNVDAIPRLPNKIADKYRDNVFNVTQREITSEESVYFKYEKLLTDNHRIIKDGNYLDWLLNFHQNGLYPNEGNFCRRWTQKATSYGSVLDEADIVLAPLEDNKFNRLKSNLKQVECWSRKLPMLCSGIPPYSTEGRNMENCILIKPASNANRDWEKFTKRLVLDADMRKKLGEQLYEDFKVKYNLQYVTEKRVEFYKGICKPEFYKELITNEEITN